MKWDIENTTEGLLRAAVAYLQRSSSKQEMSIAVQREEIREYAARHGFRIVREYVDDGISGNKLEERKAFLQMRHDLTIENMADILTVRGMDRFGRHDAMKSAAVLEPFREACIEIHMVSARLSHAERRGDMIRTCDLLLPKKSAASTLGANTQQFTRRNDSRQLT